MSFKKFLINLLGGNERHDFTDEDRQYAASLKAVERAAKLSQIKTLSQSSLQRSSISSLRDEILALRELNDELSLGMGEQEVDDTGKMLLQGILGGLQQKKSESVPAADIESAVRSSAGDFVIPAEAVEAYSAGKISDKDVLSYLKTLKRKKTRK